MSRPFGVVTADGGFVRGDVLEEYVTKAEGSRQIPAQDAFSGTKGLLAPKYDPKHLAGLLEVNTAHEVACRQKAEDVLGRGWELVKTAEDADPDLGAEVKAWLDEVPEPTNALTSLSNREVLAACQFDFESIGRAAFELIREGDEGPNPRGKPRQIVHVPAHSVRVHRDGERFVISRGGRRRWFKWAGADFDLDFESGATRDLGQLPARMRATEIVWWRNYHPSDPVYGLPDVIPAVGAIHGDLARRDYNLEFFSNFGIPAYAVFVTGDFDEGAIVDSDGNPVEDDDPTGKSELEWRIQALLKEVQDNPHSSLVFTIPTRPGLEDGQVTIEFKALAVDVKEASFRLYRKDNREEVLSSHRMSAAIAGVYDAGAANREARGQYKQSVVWPRRTTLQLLVNHFLIAGFGATGWRWQILPLDAREEDHDLKILTELVSHNAASAKELRERFAARLGLDPDTMPDDSGAGIAAVGIPALLENQVIQVNEARVMLGLDTIVGGDRFLPPPQDPSAGGVLEGALLQMRDDLLAVATKDLGVAGDDPAWWRRLVRGRRR